MLLLGSFGVQRGQKFIFSKHDHMAYQIEGDDERNRIKEKFSP